MRLIAFTDISSRDSITSSSPRQMLISLPTCSCESLSHRNMHLNPACLTISNQNPPRVLAADSHHAVLQRAGEGAGLSRRVIVGRGRSLALRLASAKEENHHERDENTPGHKHLLETYSKCTRESPQT